MSKKKEKSKSKVTNTKKTISFKEAVEGTSDIANGFCEGLKALEAADKAAVKVKENRNVDGSVNIDKTTHDRYPKDNRWDYAIGYGAKIYYVEVHPANTRNVSEMINKRTWLLNWLKTKAPLLDNYPSGNPKILWAATSAGVHILKTSVEYRRVSQMNMIPKRPVVIG